MSKRHINFYCNLSLLFFCNIKWDTIAVFVVTIVKVVRELPLYYILLPGTKMGT